MRGLVDDELDLLAQQAALVAREPQRVGLVERDVQETRLVDVHAGAIDDGDRRVALQLLREEVRDERPADPAAEDDDPRAAHFTLRTRKRA